jgi:hypothetical protein
MSSNPYQSPSLPEPSGGGAFPRGTPSPAAYYYLPTKDLARWITYIFIGNGLFELAFSVTMLFVGPMLDVEPDFATDDEFTQVMLIAVGGAGCLQVVIFIIGVVLFCKWTSRSVSNARALGAIGMEHTPGWAVGYYFIPILNLFRPYMAIKETYLASDPEADAINWKHATAPGFLLAWWLCWIFGNIVSQADIRMSNTNDLQMMAASWYVGLVSSVLTMIAAVLAARLVHSLADRQAEKYNQQQKQPAISPTMPFGEAW